MEWSEKIESKKYVFGTLISLIAAGIVSRGDVPDALMLVGIVLVAVVNQWLMFLIMSTAAHRTKESRRVTGGDNIKFVGKILLKFATMGGGFLLLVNYGRHLVAYALVLYTFQLIILVLSIKNRGALSK